QGSSQNADIMSVFFRARGGEDATSPVLPKKGLRPKIRRPGSASQQNAQILLASDIDAGPLPVLGWLCHDLSILTCRLEGQGGFMKYTDLTAVEDIDRDKMSRIVGGDSFGKISGAYLASVRIGRALLPFIKDEEAAHLVTNLGQLIGVASDATGLQGNNGIKLVVGANLPPGLL